MTYDVEGEFKLPRPNYDRIMSEFMKTHDAGSAIRDFHIRLLRLEGKTAEADELEAKTFGPSRE